MFSPADPGPLDVVEQFESLLVPRDSPDPDVWCRVVAEVLEMDGAGLSVYLGSDVAAPVGTSDIAAARGEAIQFTVREGPCVSAYTGRQAVLLDDVRAFDSPAWTRWPIYTAQFVRHTAYRGVFAFPLQQGDAIGSLNLYRNRAGPFDRQSDAALLADHLGGRFLDTMLSGGALGTDEPGSLWFGSPEGQRRRQVWLAQGMVVQANGVTPGHAMELLRAQAYSADRLLDDVAVDVVAGSVPLPMVGADD